MRAFPMAAIAVRVRSADLHRWEGLMSDTLLDVRGLTCPLPVLRAKKTLKSIDEGGLLTVLATDPSSVKDFQIFCKQTGHRLEA